MILHKNGIECLRYEPYYNNKQILVGIDSSKSNTALIVGNPYGDIYDDYEISGAGGDVNVYQLCWDTRKALKSLFDGSIILAVGLEDIITKNEKGYKGIEIHQSRAKITAVFDNLIFFFQDYHNIMPILINNQEWKAATLPEEYRKRTHEKGSKDYFDKIGGRWAGRKDDVTDAVCIYKFLTTICGVHAIREISEVIATDREYTCGLFPMDTTIPINAMEFGFNEKYSLKQNFDTAVGFLDAKSNYGYMKIPVNKLSYKDIYSNMLKRSYPRDCTEVLGIVKYKGLK